jgi:Flp pilus assembly protein TadD
MVRIAASGTKLALALLAVMLLGGGGGCTKRIVKPGAPERPLEPDRLPPRAILHEVSAGESLTRIADNYYGDADQAARIARDNGIEDPQRLTAGSLLVLRFSAAEWPEARQRAAAMTSYNRGVDLMAEERLEEAEREFEAALQAAPDWPNVRYNLALVSMQRGRHEKAEALLERLVADRPQDHDILFAYGRVLFLEARFAEAVTVFQKLMALDPQHRRGAFGLARSLQETGRRDEAIVAWEAYLQLDSSSGWAHIARQNLAQLRGE